MKNQTKTSHLQFFISIHNGHCCCSVAYKKDVKEDVYLRIEMWRKGGKWSHVGSYLPKRFSSSATPGPPSVWIDSKNRVHYLREEYLHLNTRVKQKYVDLLSWNVLGPHQGESDQYSFTSTLDATKWKRREDRIINYLLLIRPSIICLQELSFDSITTSPAFQKLSEAGYVCASFAPTTETLTFEEISSNGNGYNNASTVSSSSSIPLPSHSHATLGCGIFIQQEKFAVISSHKITLGDFAPLMNCQVEEYAKWIKKKPHSIAVCHLLLKATNQRFLLGNTRLCSNECDPDVRAIQTQSIVNSLTTLLKQEMLGSDLPPGTAATTPVILCGDFASPPLMARDEKTITHPALQQQPQQLSPSQSRLVDHTLTAPFHILSRGSLPTDHPEHPDSWSKKIKRTDSPELGMFMTRHPKLILSNIYHLDSFRDQQPLWTTKSKERQGWVDHVWVNSDVKVRRVLSPLIRASDPKAQQLNSSLPFLPTKSIPSDHTPVGCVVSFPPPRLVMNQTQTPTQQQQPTQQREEEQTEGKGRGR